MAVRIRESTLTGTRRIEDRTVEATASGSLRLPGELPDVASVIRWTALCSVDRVEPDPASGRVEAHGRVRVWVVYQAAGAESPDPAGGVFGGRLDGELSFSASAEVPQEGENPSWSVTPVVRDVDGRFRPDGRTADVDTVVNLRFEATATEESRVVSQVWASPPERIEASTATLRLRTILGRASHRLSVEEAHGLDLPGGPGSRFRVLDVHVQPILQPGQASTGEVIAKGELAYEVLYAAQQSSSAQLGLDESPGGVLPGGDGVVSGEEGSPSASPAWVVKLASWTGSEGFESAIPIEGTAPASLVRTSARVVDVAVRTLVADGMVVISSQVELQAMAMRQDSVPVITDLRAEGGTIEQRKISRRLDAPAGEGRRTFSSSATLDLPQGQVPIDRIVWSGSSVESLSARAEPGRVHVSASLTPWAYYLPHRADAQSGGLRFAAWPSALSVEQVVALPDLRPEAEVEARIESVTSEFDLISRQTVEVTVSGTCRVEAQTASVQDVLAEAVFVKPPEGPEPLLYLVVTQAGDTVWKLSRRYRTSPERILAANPDLQGYDETQALPVGARLFIVRGA